MEIMTTPDLLARLMSFKPVSADVDRVNAVVDFLQQYLAGLGLNNYDSAFIYVTIVAFRRYPKDLFAINGGYGELLRLTFEPLSSPQ